MTRPAESCRTIDNNRDCDILVDAWLEPDGRTCKAAVVKSQNNIGFRREAQNKKIDWRLTDRAADDGFRFLPNGIEPTREPEGNQDRWRSNFEGDVNDVAGGKRIKLKNKNDPNQTQQIEYHYLVRVQLERLGMPPMPCTPVDPIIKNQR